MATESTTSKLLSASLAMALMATSAGCSAALAGPRGGGGRDGGGLGDNLGGGGLATKMSEAENAAISTYIPAIKSGDINLSSNPAWEKASSEASAAKEKIQSDKEAATGFNPLKLKTSYDLATMAEKSMQIETKAGELETMRRLSK